MTFDEPIAAGFVIHAWAVADRASFEQMLDAYLTRLSDGSAGRPEEVSQFNLRRKPPGRPSRRLLDVLRESPRWADAEPSPKLDRVLLLRFVDVAQAKAHWQSEETQRVVDGLSACTSTNHGSAYQNLVRVGQVAEGLVPSYLFNFFYTDRPDIFLDTWKQTSMWFFRHTGLTSSFVLRDVNPDSRFPFINYAHWDSLWRLVLSILLRPSFRRQVAEPFERSRMLPNPILYRHVPAH